MKLARSIPYFNAIMKAPSGKRVRILQSFPTFVVDDLVEILYNVVIGNVKLSTKSKRIALKYRKQFEDITRVARNQSKRRALLYKQKGGFLGAIIPVLASIVGGILGGTA